MYKWLRIWIVCFIFCLNDLTAQSPDDPLLSIPVTASYSDMDLLDILYDLEQNYSVQFFYKEEWLPRTKANYQFEQKPLMEVLDEILKPVDLDYVSYRQQAIIVGPKLELVRLTAFSVSRYISTVQKQAAARPTQYETDQFTLGDSSIRPLPSQASISGTLYNQETEEGIPIGKITFPDLETGTFTDSVGFFSIQIPTGTHEVIIEANGHDKRKAQIRLFSDDRWNVGLYYTAFQLEEVLLEGERAGQSVDNAQAGKIQLSMIEMRRTPALLGEIDVVNTLLLLPGVSSVGEASTGFNVRGGNVDQNLMTQDGSLVFNSSHLLGFFSIFNPDVVSGVTLYKGHMPAQYGSRVSSVLEVDIMDGSYRKWNGRGSLGLFSSKAMINGPLKLERSSFVAAARTAYPNLLTQYFNNNPELSMSRSNYVDLTTKITQKIGEGGKLSLFGYASNDFFQFANRVGFRWQTLSAGLTYQQIFSEKLSMKTAVNSGRYNSEFFNSEGPSGAKNFTGLDHISPSFDLQWVPNADHNIHIGFIGTLYDMHPNDRIPLGDVSALDSISAPKDQGLEMGFYINDDFSINPFISFSVGLRYSHYMNMGPFDVQTYGEGLPRRQINATGIQSFGPNETIQTYNGLEPRISTRILINESASIKLSYNRVKQYLHLLSNSASATPIDIWQVSNTYFPAQTANNFSAGFFKNFQDRIWQTSIEFFYRELDGLVVPKDYAELLGNATIETEFLNASGLAYGAELSIKRNYNNLNIESSFAYTRALRRTENNPSDEHVNGGAWFPSDFDSPINVSLTVKWRHMPSRTLSASFVYRTGRPVTVPTGILSVPPSWDIPLFSRRNTYRIPDYHRLDLAYTFDEGLISRRRLKSEFTISIYNVYARQNAFSVFFQKNGDNYQANQLSILGTILPFASYNFRF